MTGPEARSLSFRLVKSFLGFTTRLYFDRIHVAGRKNLPPGVCILAGNHPSGLLDPLVVMSAIPEKTISGVAKHSLFQTPLISRFLEIMRAGERRRSCTPFLAPATALPNRCCFRTLGFLGGIPAVLPFLAHPGPTALFSRHLPACAPVPVAKAHDAGLSDDKQASPEERQAMNKAMFQTVQDRMLDEGVSIAIFPEGTCHSTVALKELKTGTALMALQVAALGAKAGRKDRIPIVPVGLNYSEASGQLWRSNVLVDIGRPIEVTDEMLALFSSGDEGAAKATRLLTDTLEEHLRYVALSSPNWKDELLLYCNRKGRPPPQYQLEMLLDGSWVAPSLEQAATSGKTCIRASVQIGSAEQAPLVFHSRGEKENGFKASKRQRAAHAGVRPMIPAALLQEASRAAFFGVSRAVGYDVFGSSDDRFIELINMSRRLYKPETVQFALKEYAALTRNFTAGFLRTEALVDPDFQRIWEDVDAYDRKITSLGISDSYIRQHGTDRGDGMLSALRKRTVRELAKDAVMVPMAAFGAAAHLPVLGVAWYAGTRFGVEDDGDASVVATMKVIAGFVTLSTFYPLAGLTVYWLTGVAAAGPAWMALVAASGYETG